MLSKIFSMFVPDGLPQVPGKPPELYGFKIVAITLEGNYYKVTAVSETVITVCEWDGMSANYHKVNVKANLLQYEIK